MSATQGSERALSAEERREALGLAEELMKCWALLPTPEHEYPWRDMPEADQDARELVRALLAAERENEALREAVDDALLVFVDTRWAEKYRALTAKSDREQANHERIRAALLAVGAVEDASYQEVLADFHDQRQRREAAEVRLKEVEGERDDWLRGRLRAFPDEEYGHSERYWLRQKLAASVRHLRDVEDFYRVRGGLPVGFDMIRADRARSLYEQISDDFLNGNVQVPTMRDRAERAEAQLRVAREGLEQIAMPLDSIQPGWDVEDAEVDRAAMQRIARDTLARLDASEQAASGSGGEGA